LTINSGLGSNAQFDITSNVSWSISDDATWLTVNPKSGSNNETITVTAASANTSTSSRTATVTVSGTGVADKTVTVIQQGADPSIPTVTTTSVSSITHNSALSGGNVTDDGGASVIVRGVCWSTSQNPTTVDSHTTNGSGTGAFISSITGLSPNTTYYVRAYATNSVGTSYGTQFSFATLDPCNSVATVNDIDGNTYNTIAIGTQCWMTENMRTTKYPDGSPITKGPVPHGAAGWDTDNAYYSCPPNSSNDGEDFAAAASLGMLYQWSAAMDGSTTEGAQGICPDGWR
ncbi:unnamed protein product, partial [marine sediment metagenome]